MGDHTRLRAAHFLLLIPVLLVAAAVSGPPDPTPSAEGAGVLSGSEGMVTGGEPSWSTVERLVSEQKLEAASAEVAKILEAARLAGNADEWTRALVEEVQLRTALHGYARAVRFLSGQDWPEEPLQRAVLELTYANALVTYVHAYGWEIRQREKVVADDEVDLEKWTLDQIVAEANRAFHTAFARRIEWGHAPIGGLARYIEQNDYPPGIRGTLRDAVSYLWVEELADTSLWRAGQAEETYRLDLGKLLAGDPDAADTLDLTDPRVHPVEKIGAILADLEAWHLADGEPEAALEARLERLRRLHTAFESQEDRSAVVAALESTLTRFDHGLPWWSQGQSILAELLQGSEESDSLIEARRAALAGAERHPDSVGGRRCAHIAAAIEAPDFSLTAMALDGPGKRSIRIAHRNLDALYLRAWRYDLYARVEESEDYNLLPSEREVPEIIKRPPDAEWRVELPATPDYRSHLTYATPPMHSPGAYLVVASARRDFDEDANRLLAVNLVVGDLVLVVRQVDGAWEVTARSGATGGALADAEVSLYRADWRRGHREVERERTGIDGRARFELPGSSSQYFLLARWRDHVAIDQQFLYPHREGRPQATSGAFVYTDRSVYRPQQTIHVKVVAYGGGGEEASWHVAAGTSVAVTLVDANGETVASADLKTNDFGSAAGTFKIPAGRLLGQWWLRTSPRGQAAVRVEEYKRPTFEVEVAKPAAALRLNRPAELSGSARYYFGLPVVTGDVSWRVTREPVFPAWWFWWHPPRATEQRVVAAGETSLGEDGAFALRFTPQADEREAEQGVTYTFRLSVDVTDEGGETRSASRVFRLGFVAVEARISSEVGFFLARQGGSLTVLRTDLDGTPRPGQGRWRLVRLEQPTSTLTPADQPLPEPPGESGYRTPGDGLRPRWEADVPPQEILARWRGGEELAAGVLAHGADGVATVELPDLSAGAYRLHYETTDDFGAAYETRRELLVAGRRATPVALPELLLVERASVAVGETARLLIHSGLRDQPLVLEVYRAGRRSERRVLHSGRDAELIEIPVGPADRGGFGITLTALRDHQLMRSTARVFVPWDDEKLAIQFATFRDRMRPGTRETFRVTVKGSDGEPVEAGAAELLAYMYDRSLDIFAPHSPPDPLSLYPDRTGTGTARANLGPAQVVWFEERGFARLPSYPYLRGDRLKVMEGYGIGGPGRRDWVMMKAEGHLRVAQPQMAMSDAAVAAEAAVAPSAAAPQATPEPAVELRSNFAETAFFAPHLLTDADGAAVIEFEVPDSVTDWNLWVHAITRDLRAGSVHRTTASVKELMVRPYLPRFLREGDRAELEVVVNNAGEEPLEGTLDFEILDPDSNQDLRAEFGLAATAATAVPFTVAPGAGATLRFPVATPARVGTVAFRVTARAGDLSDGELRPLPVLPGRMHLVQSRFVTLHDADRRELRFPDMAAGDDPSLINEQLVVTVDAQLFYSVLNALPYLVSYPYECTEQTLNRFLSTGIVSSLYGRYPAVQRMAEKLSERETRLAPWQAEDPNRRMLLEETPWLVRARGGGETPDELINVLDPKIAAAQREDALAKLGRAQTSLGAFPWFPGGPPSPYMTLYILYGFSKALEFGVDVPQDVVVRGWAYMHRHYVDELAADMMADDCCWETITFLNYVLSNYPGESWTGGVFTAEDRQRMLDYSFGHWKQHSPLLKSYLALTLERAGRGADAALVFELGDGLRRDRSRPGHLLGAGGEGLALVQRHHRDPRAGPAHPGRARAG